MANVADLSTEPAFKGDHFYNDPIGTFERLTLAVMQACRLTSSDQILVEHAVGNHLNVAIIVMIDEALSAQLGDIRFGGAPSTTMAYRPVTESFLPEPQDIQLLESLREDLRIAALRRNAPEELPALTRTTEHALATQLVIVRVLRVLGIEPGQHRWLTPLDA